MIGQRIHVMLGDVEIGKEMWRGEIDRIFLFPRFFLLVKHQAVEIGYTRVYIVPPL